MNIVMLGGRLTKDPEVKKAGEMAVVDFSIATDKYIKGERSADFHNCTAFGKTAEFISKFFKKGSYIIVRGNNSSGSYTAKDGHTVYTYKVVVNEVEFGGSKSNDNASTPSNTKSNKKSKSKSNEFIDVPDGADDDGLPFD